MLDSVLFFFFFNDTATTEIYTLSLHDALPIYWMPRQRALAVGDVLLGAGAKPHATDDPLRLCPERWLGGGATHARSEEHTSELQSQSNLVCRLLLEKKKTITRANTHPTIHSSR